MTPRKHAELIKAWADGAEIQRSVKWAWIDDPIPTWEDDEHYRRKPVPKADYVLVRLLIFARRSEEVIVRVTFNGETGEPKKVEIVK